jgi:hypothetical protein
MYNPLKRLKSFLSRNNPLKTAGAAARRLFRDFKSPFSPPPRASLSLGDPELRECHLQLVGSLAGTWLDRVEKSRTPLTGAFNRACRGNNMLLMLSMGEASYKLKAAPQAAPETRLIALAEAAEKQGEKADGWDKLLPRLKAVSAALGDASGAGAWQEAAAARAALRQTKPKAP